MIICYSVLFADSKTIESIDGNCQNLGCERPLCAFIFYEFSLSFETGYNFDSKGKIVRKCSKFFLATY